jgi:hypothetical protein
MVPVAPRAGRLRPLGLDEVTITGGFWGERQRVNGEVTTAHCAHWLERLGWIGNFDRTAVGDDPARPGREFADSETYKLLEALAWEFGRTGDTRTDEAFRSIAARVVAAQQEDGYLNTRFGGPGQPARYSDLEWGHELYCAGHLMQAAVARLRTAGEDDLVRAARRLADHVCEVFGPGGMESVCGHPEIEVGLTELARATGEDRYAAMAGLFLERRGTGTLAEIELGQAYFQDDVPIRKADVLRGHAVRALYLSAAAVDHAVDTGDDELLDALERQWERTTARRTYLTGGMGSRHEGEAFGDDFELSPDRAYSETCAGVGSVMLAWRLLLATGTERYADAIERTLYNVVATGPDSGGAAFFYTNPLQQRTPGDPIEPDTLNPRAAGGQRAPWFAVSCCPTNIARTFASVAGYVATADDSGVQIHQLAPSRITTRLDDGTAVDLEIATDYPSDGRMTVVSRGPSAEWTLSLRVPSWARGQATLAVAGERTVVVGDVARVTRTFSPGDEVVLEVPVAPRFTWPDDRIDAVRGQVAVEQGPLVLCAESVDVPGLALDSLRVRTDTAPARTADGRTVVRGTAPSAVGHDVWPYHADRPADRPDDRERTVEIPLVPYPRWAERGPSTMRVWLPAGT